MPLIDRIFGRLERWNHDRKVSILKRSFRSCGVACSIDLPTIIRGGEHIDVGDRVSINAFVHIWGQGGLSIGSDTLIASHVAITTLTHEVKSDPRQATLLTKATIIGRNVWIGSHAVIMPGVHIGDNAVVGAGAVVTRDVPADSVVAGVPARPLN